MCGGGGVEKGWDWREVVVGLEFTAGTGRAWLGFGRWVAWFGD